MRPLYSVAADARDISGDDIHTVTDAGTFAIDVGPDGVAYTYCSRNGEYLGDLRPDELPDHGGGK